MSGHILLHDMTMYAKCLRPDCKGQCVVPVPKCLTWVTLLCRRYELLNLDRFLRKKVNLLGSFQTWYQIKATDHTK